MIPFRRHAIAAALAVLAVVTVLVGLVLWQQSRLARALGADRLQTGQIAQRVIEAQYSERLQTRVELIAGNQAFVGYVAQALGGALPGVPIDTRSIVDLLQERREQLGLAVAAVLDAQGTLVVATERFSEGRQLSGEPLFVQARDNQAIASGVWLDGERLLHVAILPLAADGSSDGFLLVGVPLDHAIARAVADVGGTEVALLAVTREGVRIMASTLDAAAETALGQALPQGTAALPNGALRLPGSSPSASVAPLFGGGVGQLVTLVSPTRGVVASPSLLLPVLLGGALAVTLVLACALLWWRRVAEPSAVLAGLLDRAAAGDYHLKADDGGEGVVARVAASFNKLMAHLQAR